MGKRFVALLITAASIAAVVGLIYLEYDYRSDTGETVVSATGVAAESTIADGAGIRASAEPDRTDVLAAADSLILVTVEPGSFEMGGDGQEDERPVHTVQISSGFEISAHEITQRQYRLVMGVNPSSIKGDELPVESVSWEEAVEFCRRISEVTGETYRLPTEAEWEYACRAGSTSSHYWGGGVFARVAGEFAWYFDNSFYTSHPIADKKPNQWRLFDMSGNVAEWCADYYSPDYYQQSPEIDPAGPDAGQYRVVRGGSYKDSLEKLRSAARSHSGPDRSGAADTTGFRVVKELR